MIWLLSTVDVTILIVLAPVVDCALFQLVVAFYQSTSTSTLVENSLYTSVNVFAIGITILFSNVVIFSMVCSMANTCSLHMNI